jgi:ABC-type uncharacterized transport system permease subunit
MRVSATQAALALGVVTATPLLYAALGEFLHEKLGLLNAGVEGAMLMGAVTGYITAVHTSSILLGLIVAAAVTGVFNLVVYGIPVLLMRTSQILVSFAVWFIGDGLSAQLGVSYVSRPLQASAGNVDVPLLQHVPFLGEIFFRQPWPTYVAVVLTLAVAFLFARTTHGLSMRAIGEDPAAAHASGIPVRAWQAVYVSVGGALMGIGGAVLSLVATRTWASDMTAGRGFVAFALVIFVGWRALGLLWGSFLFGVLLVLGPVGEAHGWPIPPSMLDMAPYIFTILAVVLRIWRELRRSGTTAAPAALGLGFIRGQR